KTLAFGVSALYAGVAGSLFGLSTGFVSPDTFPVSLSIALLVGAVIGGLLVGVTVNLAGAYIPGVGGDLQLAVALAIIVAVLVLKPNGLFGRASVRRV
ncbi:MAG TPA: hypothetical protein VEU76_10805, partial [Candidatus Udaeobacter sp.]|nr:hypothetical protein [Candidatus Udaeobacter sp.]